MKGFLLGVTKLILGVSFALVLLSLTGVATARYFMAKLSVLPPRPVFDNDVALQASESTPPPAPVEAAPPTPEAEPTPEVEAVPPTPEIPPGSYEAVVIQPIGLVLRSGPGAEHQQLGGVDYNDQVLVLETDPGERWVKVRISSSGQEGWVKAGNTQALNEAPQ
ncbi:MAG: SH3 domain-containing protein [Cyanobacteria bacterium J06626_4]